MKMECLSQVVQEILNILPGADEVLVAEAVMTAASLGETTYEFILQQAINVYLEQSYDNDGSVIQSEVQELGLTSSQQNVKTDRHADTEDDIQETKQTPSNSSSQAGKYETNSVTDGFSIVTVSQVSEGLSERQSERCVEDSPKMKMTKILQDTAAPTTSEEDLTLTDFLGYMQDIIDVDSIVTDIDEVNDGNEVIDGSDKTHSELESTSGQNEGDINQVVTDSINSFTFGNRTFLPHSKNSAICKIFGRNEGHFGANPESKTQSRAEKEHCHLKINNTGDREQTVLLSHMLSQEKAMSLDLDTNSSQDIQSVNNIDEKISGKQVGKDKNMNNDTPTDMEKTRCEKQTCMDNTNSDMQGNKVQTNHDKQKVKDKTNIDKQIGQDKTDSIEDFDDEWPTLQTCRRNLPRLIKPEFDGFKKKETCVDLTFENDEDSFVLSNSLVKADIKPDIRTLNQLESANLTHQAANTQGTANLSVTSISSNSHNFIQISSEAGDHCSPGCSFWPDSGGTSCENDEMNTINASAHKTTINNIYVAPKTCTISSSIFSSSLSPMSCLATVTTPVATAANLGNHRTGLSFITTSCPSSYPTKTNLAGASSSDIVSSDNHIIEPEITTMTSLTTSSEVCQIAEGTVATTSVTSSKVNYVAQPSVIDHPNVSAATSNIQNSKLSTIIVKAAIASSPWLQSRLQRTMSSKVTSASTVTQSGHISSPSAIISSRICGTVEAVTNTAIRSTQCFQRSVSSNHTITSADCIVSSGATLPQSKLQSILTDSETSVSTMKQLGCVSSLNSTAASSTCKTLPAAMNTATMATKSFQNNTAGCSGILGVASRPLHDYLLDLSQPRLPVVINTATRSTQGFEKYVSCTPTNNASARCRSLSKPLSVPSVTAISTSMPTAPGLLSSLKTNSSSNSCRTEPAITNTVTVATNGFQNNQLDNSAFFALALGTTKSAGKRQNETCETQQVQIIPKKIKWDNAEDQVEQQGKLGNSLTELVCLPMELDAETGNIREIVCLACLKSCSADKSVRCNKYHVICKHCLKVEMCSVITTDKMNISCPLTLCNGEITLDALSSLQTSVSIEILKDNIQKKQTAASLKTIQQLEGLVSCPRCQFAAQLDEEVQIFVCASNDCQVKCCRYCKAPWLEGEQVHTGCSLFKFSGTKCFKDISVLPDNWNMYAEPKNTCQENGYVSVRVPLESVEGIKVCDFYSNTSNSRIVNITRIQNKSLWEKYVLKRKHMKEEIGEEELKEKFLFHGTGKENVDKICREGFDFRKLSRHGTSFGKGNYFSTTAHYSEKFSRHSDSMFVVRVLCGRSTQGHPYNTHPPYETSGRMFDSCVDNPSQPSMYIVYSIEQCYPAYIIKFKK